MQSKLFSALIDEKGYLLRGHFRLSSGKCSPAYVDHWGILADSLLMEILMPPLADRFADEEIDAVAGQARGGNVLAAWTAAYLSQIKNQTIRALYTEKHDPVMILPLPLWRFAKGKRVLVVEDVLTTGSNARKVIELINGLGGKTVAVAAIWNRGNVVADDVGARIIALIEEQIPAYSKEDCLACQANVPHDSLFGHGQEIG